MYPFILPHTMGGCVKHRMKRAANFNSAGSFSATRTPAAAGNRRVGTLVIYFKSTRLDAEQHLFNVGSGSSDTGLFEVKKQADNTLRINGGATNYLTSTARLRDPTAHRELVINWDTGDATASERLRAWLEGVAIAGTYNAPALNLDLPVFNNVAHRLGVSSVASAFFDGPIATVILIEGVRLGPENFGKTDARSGSRMPIRWTGDCGLNGGFYPMIGDAGDAPATAAEGFKDRAAITGAHVAANNFTPSGFAATDFIKDTPTNFRSGTDYRGNYCVLSAIDKASSISLADGGLRATTPGGNNMARATIGVKSGKWYWEVTRKDSEAVGGWYVGVSTIFGNLAFYPGSSAESWAYTNTSTKVTGNSFTAYGAAIGTNDVVGVALDCDAGTLEFYKNGVSQGIAFNTGLTGKMLFPIVGASVSAALQWQCNFGQRTFSHAVPSGYKTLVTAALPRGSFVKPSNAFAQAVGSGGGIEVSLAALRAGWSAYIEFFKRLDAAEGWRWRFSDDPTKYLDTSDTASGKQNFPALGGTNYLAGAIRVGADYGVFTAEVAHVNGVATMVNDNSGTARKAIIIRRSDAGGVWPYFHPDLTAGSLLDFSTNAVEGASSSITSIAANSFQIGAGMATGTYRCIVIAEKPGLNSLRKTVGNASTDGPVANHGGKPAVTLISDRNGNNLDGAIVHSALRNTNGVTSNAVECGSTAQESTFSGFRNIDFLAIGHKHRSSESGLNASGVDFVSIAFLAEAFATGECAAQGTAK